MLETQPPPQPQHVDKVLNNTHLMMNTHHGWLIETSGVTTRWIHAMCIAHSNHSVGLNEQHIVMNVSKVAWMRITQMPCDHTRNQAWRVAHRISFHAQPTHWCKCGKRMTVDHVHFECRFVKPLWSIIAQANGLTVNGIDTTNTTGIS